MTRLARLLPPETAHRLAINLLRCGLYRRCESPPALKTKVMGLEFPNPIGVAAGFDKDGEVPDELLDLGFGFAEVGTVTPRPQPGNPRPRIFRLPADRALINRCGFNNAGFAAVQARLARRRSAGVTGINIGPNRDSPDFIADFAAGIDAFKDLADYLVLNISSPNTPGLRAMPVREVAAAAAGCPVPALLKISPDLADEELEAVCRSVADCRLAGLVVANTTASRAGLSGRQAGKPGGMSGEPLLRRSLVLVSRARQLLGAGPAIIGCGGVHDGESANTMLEAGADLVQLYTALAYGGFNTLTRMLAGLHRPPAAP